MASLVYNLPLIGYSRDVYGLPPLGHSRGEAVYGHTELGITIRAALSSDELVAEFGQVPERIQVVIHEPDGTPPANAWLNTTTEQETPS